MSNIFEAVHEGQKQIKFWNLTDKSLAEKFKLYPGIYLAIYPVGKGEAEDSFSILHPLKDRMHNICANEAGLVNPVSFWAHAYYAEPQILLVKVEEEYHIPSPTTQDHINDHF